MDVLEKSIHLIRLYDIYQSLLTEKQREYFESYYFDDYTLQEISENYNVSRNAVHDQLKRTANKLVDFEEKLKLQETNQKRNKVISKLKQVIKEESLLQLIDELEKVE